MLHRNVGCLMIWVIRNLSNSIGKSMKLSFMLTLKSTFFNVNTAIVFLMATLKMTFFFMLLWLHMAKSCHYCIQFFLTGFNVVEKWMNTKFEKEAQHKEKHIDTSEHFDQPSSRNKKDIDTYLDTLMNNTTNEMTHFRVIFCVHSLFGIRSTAITLSLNTVYSVLVVAWYKLTTRMLLIN